ncbi:hypothetical protein [Candidatus Poriferisodalis sp.]|uniref:hypothetical protein n=1 Tax=Candidatus Poriferisodalis sp. TaxID=3101277 RepID=UPI003B01A92C
MKRRHSTARNVSDLAAWASIPFWLMRGAWRWIAEKRSHRRLAREAAERGPFDIDA